MPSNNEHNWVDDLVNQPVVEVDDEDAETMRPRWFTTIAENVIIEPDTARRWLDVDLSVPRRNSAPITFEEYAEGYRRVQQEREQARQAHEAALTAQAVATYTPRTGDYVRITRSSATHRLGEVVVIEAASEGNMGCGIPSCTTCRRTVSVMSLVPAGASLEESREWNTSYLYVDERHIEPWRPTQPGQTVRCDAHAGGAHPFGSLGSDCVNPVQHIGRYDDVSELASIERLLPTFREVFANELRQREERLQAARDRVASMRVGERYLIERSSSSYYGHVAQIVELPSQDSTDDRVLCNIFYPDGELRRTHFFLRPSAFGTRWTQMFNSRNVPGFIRFGANTNYSGSRNPLRDQPVGESLDDHECEEECFEYGCRARVVDDQDDDLEYAGEVPIHSYSYRPELVFSGEGPVFMGSELELSTGNGSRGERAQQAAAKIITESQIGDLVYLKSDGSISGYGFEAVFHPMSYDWLLENWPEDLLRNLRNAGAMPHSSCGMHVHVGRTGFSDAVHAYKWIKFMYRNKGHMVRMARRDPSQWGSFDHDAERAAAKWHAKGGYGAYTRYTAINCTPRETFEVRIFASTLNRTRFLGSMGLVDASVEYTRQLSTQDILKNGGWEFAPFREFVSSFTKYQPLQREFSRILG